MKNKDDNQQKINLPIRCLLGVVLSILLAGCIVFFNIAQTKLIERSKTAILQEFELNTGFRISYDRISPNILTALDIYNVVLTNNQGIRLELGTIEVGYSIFRTIFIPTSKIGAFVLIKTIKLKDFQVDVTKNELISFIENIKAQFAGRTYAQTDFIDKIKNISFRMPLANITIHNEDRVLNVILHNLKAEFDDGVNVGLDINAVYQLETEQLASINCGINGKIDKSEDNIVTDLNLSLNKAHLGFCDIFNLNFNFSSSGQDFTLRKLQNAMNFDVLLSKNAQNLSLNVAAQLLQSDIERIIRLDRFENALPAQLQLQSTINYDLSQKKSIQGVWESFVNIGDYSIMTSCDARQGILNINNCKVYTDNPNQNITIAGNVPIFETPRKLNVAVHDFMINGLKLDGTAVLAENNGNVMLSSNGIRVNDIDLGTFQYNLSNEKSTGIMQVSTKTALNGYYVKGSIITDENKNKNLYLDHTFKDFSLNKLINIAGINLRSSEHNLLLNGKFNTNIIGGQLSMPAASFQVRQEADKDNKIASLSVSMTDSVVSINKMELFDGRFSCGGNVRYDKSQVNTNMTLIAHNEHGKNSLYRLNGVIDKKNIKININNLAKFTFNIPTKKLYLTGSNFPIVYKDNQILLSCNFVGDLTKQVINQTSFSIDNLKFFNNRQGKLSGQLSYNQNVLQLTNCVYADGSNNISGKMTANLTDITALTDNVAKVKSNEKKKIDIDKLRLSGNAFFVDDNKKESYSLDYFIQDGNVDAKLYLTNFAMNKFGIENLAGMLNTRIHAIGKLNNPIVDIQGEVYKARYGKNKLDMSFAIKKDTRQVSIKKATINLGEQNIKITNSNCTFSQGYKNFNLTANVYLSKIAKIVKTDLNVVGTFADFKKDAHFAMDIGLKNINVSYLKNGSPVEYEKFDDIKFSFKHKDGNYTLFNYGQKFIDVSLDTKRQKGFANLYKNKSIIMAANFAGVASDNDRPRLTGNVKIRKFPANIAHKIVYPFVGITDGLIDGDLIIGGTAESPQLNGRASLYYGSVDLKEYLPDPISNITGIIVFDNNKMYVNNVNGMVKKGLVHGNGEVVFNKGKFESFHFDITSNTIPAKVKNGPIDAVGSGHIDSFVLEGQPGSYNFLGNIVLESAEVNLSNFGSLASGKGNKAKHTLPLNVELNIIAGEKLKVNYPIINVQVKQGEVFTFHYAGSEPAIYLGGEVNVEKGVLNYFNKEFKIENASFTFYEDEQKINPFVNMKSYYRTKDNKNNNVMIYLTINDRLSSFKTNVSSIPYKTVSEINSLLGTAFATNDDERDVYENYNYTPDIDNVVNTTNYLSSAFMFSPVENVVKRVTGFDTFSVNTSIFGNMIKSNNNWLDLIDNTELTFGKYLTNELYIGSAMSFQKLTDTNHLFLPFQNNNYGINMELFMQLELPYLSIGYKFLPKDYSNILKSEHQISVEANFKF